MLAYIGLFKLFLTLAVNISKALSDKQLLDAGRDKQVADMLTQLNERVLRKKKSDAEVDALSDDALSRELSNYTRPNSGSERLLPIGNPHNGKSK